MNSVFYDDGGHRAIIGFFYQTLQTAGLVIELQEQLVSDTCIDGCETLSVVLPEVMGADAVGAAMLGDMAFTKVVQHKYSETSGSHAENRESGVALIAKTRQHNVMVMDGSGPYPEPKAS